MIKRIAIPALVLLGFLTSEASVIYEDKNIIVTDGASIDTWIKPVFYDSYTVWMPQAASDANGYLDQDDWQTFNSKSMGPSSSTDHALARWDGTGGNLLQDSSAILNDDGLLTLSNTTSGVNDLLYLEYENVINSGGQINFGAGNLVYSRIESVIDADGEVSLRFYDYHGASLQEVMRIDGGNVGIGETSPSSKLEVDGDIEIDGGTIIYDVNNISADIATFETYGLHIIDSSGAGITGTLADGTKVGRSVKFVCKVAGNDIDITIAHHVTSDPEVIRLDAAKELIELVWDGTDWVEVDGNGQSYP